jgi:ABC-type anion transport system duplicated permease subunit
MNAFSFIKSYLLAGTASGCIYVFQNIFWLDTFHGETRELLFIFFALLPVCAVFSLIMQACIFLSYYLMRESTKQGPLEERILPHTLAALPAALIFAFVNLFVTGDFSGGAIWVVFISLILCGVNVLSFLYHSKPIKHVLEAI